MRAIALRIADHIGGYSSRYPHPYRLGDYFFLPDFLARIPLHPRLAFLLSLSIGLLTIAIKPLSGIDDWYYQTDWVYQRRRLNLNFRLWLAIFRFHVRNMMDTILFGDFGVIAFFEGVYWLLKQGGRLVLNSVIPLLSIIVGGYMLFVWVPNNVPVGPVRVSDYMTHVNTIWDWNRLGILAHENEVRVFSGSSITMEDLDVPQSSVPGGNMMVILITTKPQSFLGVTVQKVQDTFQRKPDETYYQVFRPGNMVRHPKVLNQLTWVNYPSCNQCPGFQRVVIVDHTVVDSSFISWPVPYGADGWDSRVWSWAGFLNGRREVPIR